MRPGDDVVLRRINRRHEKDMRYIGSRFQMRLSHNGEFIGRNWISAFFGALATRFFVRAFVVGVIAFLPIERPEEARAIFPTALLLASDVLSCASSQDTEASADELSYARSLLSQADDSEETISQACDVVKTAKNADWTAGAEMAKAHLRSAKKIGDTIAGGLNSDIPYAELARSAAINQIFLAKDGFEGVLSLARSANFSNGFNNIFP